MYLSLMTPSVKMMICLDVGLFQGIKIPNCCIKQLADLKKGSLLEHSGDKSKLLPNTTKGTKLMCINIER